MLLARRSLLFLPALGVIGPAVLAKFGLNAPPPVDRAWPLDIRPGYRPENWTKLLGTQVFVDGRLADRTVAADTAAGWIIRLKTPDKSYLVVTKNGRWERRWGPACSHAPGVCSKSSNSPYGCWPYELVRGHVKIVRV